jgi:23S rRNA pseudouridine2605 synthase
MIEAGRVSVNGAIITRLGSRADPEADDIRLDGRRVGTAQRRRYIVLNKPAGYVTTRDDPERRKTVLDLIPRVREYIYPVGRLDYDSEGLLLLTNDGDLAARLTHPRHGIERVYEAMTRGVPSATKLQKLASGIALDGRRTAPAEVQLLGGHTTRRIDRARIRVILKEGRNRQVRRMFEAIGHPVVRLRRTRFGPLSDRGLKVGAARELSREELNALQRAVDAPSSARSTPARR